MVIRLHPEADKEFIAAKQWYDIKLEGLGNKFVDEVEAGYELINDNSKAGMEIEEGIRKFVLNKFPFSILYVEATSQLYVLAIAHHNREPGYWRTRN